MLSIKNLKLDLNDDLSLIEKKIRKKLRLSHVEKFSFKIVKESIDARKGKIHFIYQVVVDLDYERFENLNDSDIVKLTETVNFDIQNTGKFALTNRPVVVGFGPAGMFAALLLAQKGFRPIVFELGKDIDSRSKDVEKFWSEGILNENSNVQYGEGGAGTFSDGKLTTRIKDKRVNLVLEELHRFGGPEEIVYSHKAHIGTDILKEVVKNIRKEIITLGGEIIFESKLDDIHISDEKLTGVSINGTQLLTNACILAIGNSGRDTYRLLNDKQIKLTAKPFAVGFRIEHPKVEIDKSQYKENYLHPKLKAASYNLTSKASNGKNCYTFCMCPGGEVIGASSESGGLVINGMSYHNRDSVNSNSAILCSVNAEDFGDDIFDGMKFQEEIERKAYLLGGGNYKAPVQKVGDFLNGKPTKSLGSVTPSYKIGYTMTNLSDIYSQKITSAIKEAIISYGNKISAFKMDDAILTGVETRSSSPIRINRNDDLMVDNVFGLFPAGEGSGYAGGIMSSAVDGIKCAESLIKTFYLED